MEQTFAGMFQTRRRRRCLAQASGRCAAASARACHPIRPHARTLSRRPGALLKTRKCGDCRELLVEKQKFLHENFSKCLVPCEIATLCFFNIYHDGHVFTSQSFFLDLWRWSTLK